MRAPTFEVLDQVFVNAPRVLPDHDIYWDDPEPPRKLVASRDIERVDQLGRTYVLVPKGRPPGPRAVLTEQEEATLVEPPPPPPKGYMHPGLGGVTPHDVVVGTWEKDR
jgi:hypothetical protein